MNHEIAYIRQAYKNLVTCLYLLPPRWSFKFVLRPTEKFLMQCDCKCDAALRCRS